MPHVKWNGPDAVDQFNPETGRTVTVEPGHQLEVTAQVRDELVARKNGWTEVKDPGGAKAKAAADKESK